MYGQEAIDKIRKNEKVTRLDVLPGIDNIPYASINYQDKNQKDYCILVDVHNLYLLINGFSITTTPRGLQYVIPRGSSRSLHQIITGSGGGYVGHHMTFTLDNRESSLQLVRTGVHSRFHRYLKVLGKADTIKKYNVEGDTND